MSEEKPSGALRILSAISAGAASGIFMAAIILFMMNLQGFSFGTMSVASIGAIACALPAFLDILKRRGIPCGISEVTMIAVSFIACLLYVHSVAKNETAVTRMSDLIFIFHGLSLVLNVGRLVYLDRKGR